MGADLKKVIEKKLGHYKERLSNYDKDSSSYKCTQSRIHLLEELKEG